MKQSICVHIPSFECSEQRKRAPLTMIYWREMYFYLPKTHNLILILIWVFIMNCCFHLLKLLKIIHLLPVFLLPASEESNYRTNNSLVSAAAPLHASQRFNHHSRGSRWAPSVFICFGTCSCFPDNKDHAALAVAWKRPCRIFSGGPLSLPSKDEFRSLSVLEGRR